MVTNNIDYIESQENKIKKLKNMRRIATGLLGLMAILYLIFKRFEDRNIIFSMIVAFTEAAMVGALADWFAVVALFRHPLGMSWIPHTAIIQKNRDKLGESLSTFVVSNFFTDEIIKGKLRDVRFTESIATYIEQNKEAIAKRVSDWVPALLQMLFNNDKLIEFTFTHLKRRLKETDVMPILEKALLSLFSSGAHTQLAKYLLKELYQWVTMNREQTFKILEGIDKKLTLPFVGDMVYKSILASLARIVVDMENGDTPEFIQEALSKLPDILVSGVIQSEEINEKISSLKDEFLESEQFKNLFIEKLSGLKDELTTYCVESEEAVTGMVGEGLQLLLDYLSKEDGFKENVDTWMKAGVADIICTYRYEIARLIRDTVENWPMEDMVDKMETQVGGDLQYIRINGTVIGGLAGLAIHLLSYLL